MYISMNACIEPRSRGLEFTPIILHFIVWVSVSDWTWCLSGCPASPWDLPVSVSGLAPIPNVRVIKVYCYDCVLQTWTQVFMLCYTLAHYLLPHPNIYKHELTVLNISKRKRIHLSTLPFIYTLQTNDKLLRNRHNHCYLQSNNRSERLTSTQTRLHRKT